MAAFCSSAPRGSIKKLDGAGLILIDGRDDGCPFLGCPPKITPPWKPAKHGFHVACLHHDTHQKSKSGLVCFPCRGLWICGRIVTRCPFPDTAPAGAAGRPGCCHLKGYNSIAKASMWPPPLSLLVFSVLSHHNAWPPSPLDKTSIERTK